MCNLHYFTFTVHIGSTNILQCVQNCNILTVQLNRCFHQTRYFGVMCVTYIRKIIGRFWYAVVGESKGKGYFCYFETCVTSHGPPIPPHLVLNLPLRATNFAKSYIFFFLFFVPLIVFGCVAVHLFFHLKCFCCCVFLSLIWLIIHVQARTTLNVFEEKKKHSNACMWYLL